MTAGIECLLAAVLFRKGRSVYCVFLCNLLTNPAVNAALIFAYRYGGRRGYHAALWPLELLVVVTEAFVLKRMLSLQTGKAAGASFLLNLASLSAGLLFY